MKTLIGDITENLDKLRKPLNNSERLKISAKKIYPYYGANNIIDYIDEYIFDGELLCVAEDGGTWGLNQPCSYIINNKCWVNNHAHVLKMKPNVNIKYLMYYLNHKDLDKYISGAVVRKLTQKSLSNIEIDLKSIDGQKRIVKELDKIYDAIKNREMIMIDLQKIIDSELNILPYEDSLFMNDIFTIIDGDRGKNYPKQNEFFNIGYCLFLNTGNVTKTGFDFSNRKFITKEKDSVLNNGKLQKNDLILTTRGTLGNVALYDEKVLFDNLRINSGMVILRLKNSLFLPKYLEVFMRSNLFQIQIKNNLSGTAQPQIPISILKKLNINNVTLSDQQKIIEKIILIEQQKELIQQDISDLEALFENKMHEYFD